MMPALATATVVTSMAQRTRRASVGRDDNVLSFAKAPAPDSSKTALNLVYQAAEVFSSLEDHARETEARAQSLLERLKLAEWRAEDGRTRAQ